MQIRECPYAQHSMLSAGAALSYSCPLQLQPIVHSSTAPWLKDTWHVSTRTSARSQGPEIYTGREMVQGWRYMAQLSMLLTSWRTANQTPVKIQYMPGPHTWSFKNMCQTVWTVTCMLRGDMRGPSMHTLLTAYRT